MRIEWDDKTDINKPSETNLERFDDLSDDMIDTSGITLPLHSTIALSI
jgi:hypothetical protein